MIDVKLVEAFVLLMNTGSLTRAETLTGASKATLSRQISKLEETLGVQLLTIHNLHRYMEFMRRIQEALDSSVWPANLERLHLRFGSQTKLNCGGMLRPVRIARNDLPELAPGRAG